MTDNKVTHALDTLTTLGQGLKGKVPVVCSCLEITLRACTEEDFEDGVKDEKEVVLHQKVDTAIA